MLYGIRDSGEHDSAQRALADASEKLFTLLDEQVSPTEPLAILCSRLALNEHEIRAFLLCLAPELDTRYQRIYGFFNDDLGRRNASLGLIADLSGEAISARLELAASTRLFDWRLLHSAGPEAPHADEALRVDPAILAWLFGDRRALLHDPRVRTALRERPWPGARWLQDAATPAGALHEALDWIEGQPRWLVLSGDGSHWCALLEAAAKPQQSPLLRIPLSRLGLPEQAWHQPAEPTDGQPDGHPDGQLDNLRLDELRIEQLDERLLRLARAARLTGMLPVFDASHLELGAAGVQALERAVAAFADLPTPAVLVVADVGAALAALPATGYRVLRHDRVADRQAVFAAAAHDAGLDPCADDLALLAAAYPLSLAGVERAFHLAAARGAHAAPARQQAALIGAACQLVACPQTPRFATRLAPLTSGPWSFAFVNVTPLLLPPPPQCWTLKELPTVLPSKAVTPPTTFPSNSEGPCLVLAAAAC